MKAIKPFIKDLLRKTFDIREGEYKKVLLMQLNIFLIILTLLIIKPVVNAQFISTLGVEKLPFVFVLVALCAMAVSTFYARALNSKSLRKVTSITFSISAITLVIIGIFLQSGIAEQLVLYIFYVGVANFGVLATSQFWVMANLAFNAREAKRLLGFLGAGAIAGGISGGYLTSALASLMDATNLLYIAAGFLVVCIPLNNHIWKKQINPLNKFQQIKRLKGFGDHPLRLIRNSRHLTYLACIVGLSVIVAKLVEFQFSSIALDQISDPDELTAFFGFWLSTFNVLSLIIQLFLTRLVVGNFGVGTSLFALPGGLLLGAVLLLFAPLLWAAVFIKMWDISVKQSVNKAATELLALPIPMSIKSQTKSFIDVFIDMAATGIGGLMLIFIVNGLNLSVRAVSILIIAIVVVWIWVAMKVRKEYLNSFKAKLTQADKKAEGKHQDFSDSSVIAGMKRALEKGTMGQVLWVLSKVKEVPDKRLFDNVASLLQHDSSKVRKAALDCIYYLESSLDTQHLDQLLHDPDPEVRYQAFAQLMRQTKENRMMIMNDYLQSEDPAISGAALVGLAREARGNPEMQRILKLEQRIQDKIEYVNLCDSQQEKELYTTVVLMAIGHSCLQRFYPFIKSCMKGEVPELVSKAIRSAGFTINSEFLDELILFLVKRETRDDAQKALMNYGQGIVRVLQGKVLKNEIPLEASRHIPGVIERIDSQESVEVLFDLLQVPDVMLRLEVMRSLNVLQRDHPHLNIQKERVIEAIHEEINLYKQTLAILHSQEQKLNEQEHEPVQNARQRLISILETRLDGTLERIFRLLGLRYPPDDVIPVYEGITHVSPDTRTNSIEFLENLLEPSLKKVLIPIAETAMLDAISAEAIRNLEVNLPDEKKCFQKLLEGRDPKLKLAVLDLIGVLQNKNYATFIEHLINSPVPKVRERAKKVLESLNG